MPTKADRPVTKYMLKGGTFMKPICKILIAFSAVLAAVSLFLLYQEKILSALEAFLEKVKSCKCCFDSEDSVPDEWADFADVPGAES